MGDKGKGNIKAPQFSKDYERGIQIAMKYLPQQLQQELQYRQQYDPLFIEQAMGTQEKYDPRLAQEQLDALQRRDPQWLATHQALGDKIKAALDRGYLDKDQEAAYRRLAGLAGEVDPRQEKAYGQYGDLVSRYAAQAGKGEPQREAAYGALGKQVTGDTLRGGTASPETLRQMTQAILSRQPGLSYGEAQDMAAAVYTGQRSEALKAQRQGATGQFLQQATPTQQREQSLAQAGQSLGDFYRSPSMMQQRQQSLGNFYGLQAPEQNVLGLAGTYIQPSNSITGQLNQIPGVQAPRSFGYVNPNAGYQGAQYGLQNFQNSLAAQQNQGSSNPWTNALSGAATGANYGSIGGGYGAAGGAIVGAAAGAFGYPQYSTIRLKTGIEKIGEHNGLDIIEFSYINGHCRYRGVIAEQVQKEFPDAVVVDANGFLKVDYQKIGIPFLKRCNKCRTFKDISEFPSGGNGTIDGHYATCKACKAQYSKEYEKSNFDRRRKQSAEWKLNHPGWHRNWWLKKEYGISLVEFNQMVKDQKGLCAICEEPPGKKGLHADHCHKKTLVRGLLCFRCNAALGMFRDNPRLLVNAIDYLTPKLLEGEVS